MSTRVTALAKVSAACRELVNQRLNIALGSTIELDRASTALASGRVDLPALQGLVAGGEIARCPGHARSRSPGPSPRHPGRIGNGDRQSVGADHVRPGGTRQRGDDG